MMWLPSCLSFATVLCGIDWAIAASIEDDVSLMQLPRHLRVIDRESRACSGVAVKGEQKLLPAIGLGGWKPDDMHGEKTVESIKAYMRNGGRLLDTAQRYGNLEDYGAGIRESGLPRSELWVASKVDVNLTKSRGDVVAEIDNSLKDLGVDYLDSMLLHGSSTWGAAADNVELWRGMIMAKSAGKVRNIGVANYQQSELEELIAKTGEAPALHQVEYNPYVPQDMIDLVKWCQAQGIVVQAYNVLGGITATGFGDAAAAVADEHKMTSAQVMIRWVLDQGVAAVVGASSEEHIREDLNCSTPHLSSSDFKLLETATKPSSWLNYTNGSGVLNMGR